MTKLILINGPLGSGKSTLAEAYAALEPMTLTLDIDSVWFKISDWRANYAESGRLAQTMAMEMARVHLAAGYDVAIPQIIHRPEIYDEIHAVAKDLNAQLIEVCLDVPQEIALDRYMHRHNSGERPKGYVDDTKTDDDARKARFSDAYSKMKALLTERADVVYFTPRMGEVESDAKAIKALVQEAAAESH